MGLDRSKFKNIVGGITSPTPTAPQAESPSIESETPAAPPTPPPAEPPAGQGGEAQEPVVKREPAAAAPAKRFAKTGRPKGPTTGKSTKTKVSLYIDKSLIDELYDWAYQDRMQPGELIERALRDYRNREAKRRNGGTA